MTALQDLLATFRATAKTEREKGNYFERLVKVYLQNEPLYRDMFGGKVYLWEEWRKHWMSLGNADPQSDAGIDLVAVEDVAENPRIFAIQAKFYAEDAKIKKSDGIDSFLSALGKAPFTNGMLFMTSYEASHHVIEAVQGRDKPVNIIDLITLENSKIDWADYAQKEKVTFKESKQVRDYQRKAIANVTVGLQYANRGKLIMACGTGKTFTSLRMAEELVGAGGRVLFLVPSLSLLSQTLTEWTQESAVPLHSFAVCSDGEVGKRRDKDDDFALLAHELQYPATTQSSTIAREVSKRHDNQHMSVVFSTYHSISVISQAQLEHGLAEFDLIICDEAHRTTGATYGNDDDSAFVKVHDQTVVKGKKRVYMTATPRVYGVQATAKAEKEDIVLYSMDRPEFFGETLHTLTFSEAVHGLGILCDYKVIVLTISEDEVSRALQKSLADENNSLRVDDAAKIVGCWRALSKQDTQADLSFDPDPMRRAVAFCQVIEAKKGGKTHKVSSKNIASMFQAVVDEYRQSLIELNPEHPDVVSQLICEAEHVDGGMTATQKEVKLDWLKADTPENTCRVLSNVRCLSEGVDVPALDAVLFLSPRNSQVDVVQSVGRVMRKPRNSNKKLGYVILPVVIPSGVSPEVALNDNKTYKVVWEVLQALRSHDDRFDAMINKLDLAGQDTTKMEVIAITNTLPVKQIKPVDNSAAAIKKRSAATRAKGSTSIGEAHAAASQKEMDFAVGEIEKAIIAKVVQKCGNRLYWDDWASDIAKIAQTHISRITAIIETPSNIAEIKAFNGFLKELQDDLNDSITRDEAIEMLAQHIITKPVFDALFEGYSFTQHNPVSVAMQGVLAVLNEHNLEKEAETLEKFYDSVRMRAAGIDDLTAKQKIIVELYDKFFRKAFPKMTERLGIVYTPVEVVDFIIHSVNDVLQQEFGQTLGSKGVHIIDPFTGTGTFITRLLQSGLISNDELAYKFKNEIHANEIVLLAYYIAAINIEQVYHNIMGGDYVPFEGICLTDTFALYEKDDLVSQVLADNSTRRRKQKKLDIRVIVGNPPYSVGQVSANDNNANISYPTLDMSITNSYAKFSKATSTKGLMDSYVRAFRWASDRIGTSGVIGFVSNASFAEVNAMDGMRKCLADEFTSIYVFHLRGNQRTAGEESRREGGKIFGSGSRTPVAISILVKNPNASEHGKIYFHDIGDYLTREDKLQKVADFRSIDGITKAGCWVPVTPDSYNDWVKQRDDSFGNFVSIGNKEKGSTTKIFENFSLGVVTNRDAWCYNASKDSLSRNMIRMIDFYNEEVKRYQLACEDLTKSEYPDVAAFIDSNPKKISWTRAIKNDLEKFTYREFEQSSLIRACYRPFSKQWMYYNRSFNEVVSQMPRIFPDASVKNVAICLSGPGSQRGFSVLMVDALPDLHTIQTGQCFPLKLFEGKAMSSKNQSLPGMGGEDDLDSGLTERDAITDDAIKHFTGAYNGAGISKEDLFYYIYGLLHSEEYKARYADNLSKELPRIPAVKKFDDFMAFSAAGRKLADLHLNYETVEPYAVTIDGGALLLSTFTDSDYYVNQMKFASKADKSTVIYNHKITMHNIPVEAYEYVVNGKPALEWVMERQAVTTHKDSGIVNDANLWAKETMGDAAYPLKLFQRVITVSLETMKIVKALPSLELNV
jgi:predicted helicase